jgi:N-acetylglucosamine kinase-like BadF-type ATPase
MDWLSIDWGGSELKGAIISNRGVVSQFSLPAINLRQIDQSSLSSVCEKLAGMIDKANTGWLIGAAGADDHEAVQRLESTIKSIAGSQTEVHIYSDYVCNHAACLGGKDGILSINGTGSVLYAVFAEKKARAAGWGYILDELPSGGYFGRKAIEGVLHGIEGNNDCADFVACYEAKFGLANRASIIDSIYRSQSIQRQLGVFAPLLTDAFARNNRTAQQVVQKSVLALAQAVRRLIPDNINSSIRFCGSGGLWINWPQLQSLFSSEARQMGLDLILEKPYYDLRFGPLLHYIRENPQTGDYLHFISLQETAK